MNKIGWLIYQDNDAEENASYIDWFINEAKKNNCELKLVLRKSLYTGIRDNQLVTIYNNLPTELPDFCIIRTIEPILQKHFECIHIPCFNNYEVTRICNNKALAHLEINKLGIPAVETYYLNKTELDFLLPLDFPFILKEVNGRGGQQVHLIDSKVSLNTLKPKLNSSELVIQSTDVKAGKDLRVFIIGNKIIKAVLRENEHDFRANFKLGGTARIYNLSADDITSINRIIDRFDFGLVGIDFLIGKNNELLFNEIEDVVGSRILSEK